MKFLKTLLGNLRWDLDIEFHQEIEVAEENKFYPELEQKIQEATKQRAEGKTITLETTDSVDDFWRQVREYEL